MTEGVPGMNNSVSAPANVLMDAVKDLPNWAAIPRLASKVAMLAESEREISFVKVAENVDIPAVRLLPVCFVSVAVKVDMEAARTFSVRRLRIASKVLMLANKDF